MTNEMRLTVMARSWPSDGEEKTERKCASWEDVADAVNIVLEYRTDAKAPADNIFSFEDDSPGSGKGRNNKKEKLMNVEQQQQQQNPNRPRLMKCPHCKLSGHFGDACPSAYAKEKGITEQMLKDFGRTDGCPPCVSF